MISPSPLSWAESHPPLLFPLPFRNSRMTFAFMPMMGWPLRASVSKEGQLPCASLLFVETRKPRCRVQPWEYSSIWAPDEMRVRLGAPWVAGWKLCGPSTSPSNVLLKPYCPSQRGFLNGAQQTFSHSARSSATQFRECWDSSFYPRSKSGPGQ